MANIDSGNALFHEGREVRDKLILLGGHERLVAKLEALLSRQVLHGGEQLQLEHHIQEARSCLPN
ncbi:hypothetical protein [Pseudomonas sp. LB3P14]